MGFPGGSVGKESAYNAGDPIPRSGRSPGGGNSNPLQYSCLENPHGQRSLVDSSPWDHKELDTTEATEHACKAIIQTLKHSLLIGIKDNNMHGLCDSLKAFALASESVVGGAKAYYLYRLCRFTVIVLTFQSAFSSQSGRHQPHKIWVKQIHGHSFLS